MYRNSIFMEFDQCRADELLITRNGLWSPEYFLTDGVFNYGKLATVGALMRDTTIETANRNYLIKYPALFSRETFIFSSDNSEPLGNIKREEWNNKVTLYVEGKPVASLQKQSLFSRTYNWWGDKDNNFMSLQRQFKYSAPFKVTLHRAAFGAEINTPFIALTGLQIILFKQSQAAAH